jgi:hypothetical protein
MLSTPPGAKRNGIASILSHTAVTVASDQRTALDAIRCRRVIANTDAQQCSALRQQPLVRRQTWLGSRRHEEYLKSPHSEDVLQVGESSLYPALQRLLLNGWVKAKWGTSDNNRRARYYSITAAGRKRLAEEREEFDRLINAIQRVLTT